MGLLPVRIEIPVLWKRDSFTLQELLSTGGFCCRVVGVLGRLRFALR